MPYVSKDEVKAALDAAGIAYDSDATREELVALMPEEEPKAETPKGKTVRMRLKRDRWDEAGERVRKGVVIDMDPEDAMDAIEAGTAERVK